LLYADLLHHKDHAIYRHCEEKMAIALEILEIFAKDDLSSVVSKLVCDELPVDVHCMDIELASKRYGFTRN
jgi:hypothetical protein